MTRLFKEIAALVAAFFAACVILIPAGNYIRWENWFGICFVVLLLYGLTRQLIPQLTTIFRSRAGLLCAAGVLLVTGVIFFSIKSPDFYFTGEKNLITIQPGNFRIIGLASRKNAAECIPCVGYITGDSSTWKIRSQQMYSPATEDMRQLTLELDTGFIQRNDLCLFIESRSNLNLRHSVNNTPRRKVFAKKYEKVMIDLDSPQLIPQTKKHFSVERIFFFLGIASVILLVSAFALKVGEKIYRRESVSWLLMLGISILFTVCVLPLLRYGINSPDLMAHEPNLPFPRGFKHPPPLAVLWRLQHILIPVKSVFISFAVGLLLLYMSGLMMVESFLCKLREKWLGWLVFLVSVNTLQFYQNGVLADEFLCAMIFFTMGLFAMLLNQNSKKCRLVCGILILPCLCMIMGLRHEAMSIVLVFCIALVSVFVPYSSRLRGKKAALSIAGGLLLFVATIGIHQVILRYILPLKKKSTISTETVSEVRRYQIKEILKICYYGRNYAWLPEDFGAVLPEEFADGRRAPLRIPNDMLDKFDPLPSERISEVWKKLILEHPFVYLKSKFCGFASICTKLDRSRQKWIDPQRFCWGFFCLRLPSWLYCGSILLLFLGSVVLLLHRPIFRGLLYFSVLTSAAGTAHMAALFLIPVSPQARYLYWICLSGGISFVLLLYIVWLLIWSRLGRASAKPLYINR